MKSMTQWLQRMSMPKRLHLIVKGAIWIKAIWMKVPETASPTHSGPTTIKRRTISCKSSKWESLYTSKARIWTEWTSRMPPCTWTSISENRCRFSRNISISSITIRWSRLRKRSSWSILPVKGSIISLRGPRWSRRYILMRIGLIWRWLKEDRVTRWGWCRWRACNLDWRRLKKPPASSSKIVTRRWDWAQAAKPTSSPLQIILRPAKPNG